MELRSVLRLLGRYVGYQFCLSESDVAEFIDGTLTEYRNRQVQLHLDRCGECRNQVGTLIRSRRITLGDELDPSLMTRAIAARDSARSAPARSRGWSWATATFAIASVAVMFAVLLWLHRAPHLSSVASLRGKADTSAAALASSAISPIETSGRSHRRSDVPRGKPLRGELVVLAPLQESSVDRLPVIRWRPIEHAMYYDVRLLSADGDVIWQEKVDSDRASIPPQLALLPGNEYFVLVRAYLAEGKTIDSRAVGFRWLPRS